MSSLLPLPVAVPLLAAGLLAAADGHLPRWATDALAVLAALATAALCAMVLGEASGGLRLHWFGGWEPRQGVSVGIVFTADPLGAGFALLASALALAAITFALR